MIWFSLALTGRTTRLGSIAVLLFFVGCTSSQSMFSSRILDTLDQQAGALLTSEVEVVVDEEQLAELAKLPQLPLLWESEVGERKHAVLSPIFESGAIYAASETGQLISLDPASGNQNWSVNTEHVLAGGVGAGDGVILLGTFTGEVLAYDDKGSSLWKALVTSEVLSPPKIERDVVSVRSGDGRIFGLNSVDGSQKWVYQGSTPSLTVRSSAGIVLSRGAIFAGFAGGKMVAVSLFNGNIGWEATVSQPRGVTELERMTDITSLPAVGDELVCAVAYHGRVGCFGLGDGSQVWTRKASSSAGLSMDSDYIYVSEDDGVLAAYDKRSGAGMWKQSKLGSKKLSRPLVRDHYIIVGDDQGHISVLRNYDGVVLARASTDESPILTAPLYLPDGFMVQTEKGGLFAFSLEF